MKSMQIFLISHQHVPYGIKISEGLFQDHADFKEIPIYSIEARMSDIAQPLKI